MRGLILAILPVLMLGACAQPQTSAFDAHQRFRNSVESRELTASFAASELGSADRAALRDMAREYTRRGAAPVAVSGPGADQVAGVLRAYGVPADKLVVKTAEGPATTVAVPVWVAVVPDCGRWDQDLTSDFANQNTDNFGCAVTRNIGLMVSDPADLVRARDTSGRDANRAADVLGKYGQGKATSSAAETNSTGTLSSVGK
ncbi:CpaD family pilus assembly lipoprotein [Magnetospirillum sp. 64-120]|uniref:CpaD family pilus assembly lipoprotein n=1 Tax=Magnetospirillum sp. 64-120 TaxID=1895778 RepID=UPI00092C70E2|nr:CpaD family pilus assembly lipoprotein [Magnetospirillum sp. 64-120]OJX77717.1 MAG: hypothetical protein BGO92_00820 [Magnetospirillum sp. 64-120]